METENKYKYTKAYYKIRDLILDNPEEDVFVICGGQGASKTVSIIQLIIQSLHTSPKEATVLSSELSKMKRTVMRDYTKICQDWGIMTGDSFNKSESKHEWANGSYIDFLGADVNDVGKGFRRDLLYINEADKLDIDTAVQFISRANLTIIDYNPDNHFWGNDYINENNFLRLTFEDNEYLSESEVKSILNYKERGFVKKDLPTEQLFEPNNIINKYWANKWRVYGLGLVGSLSGTVFNNWSKIDNVPPEAELLAYGLDWGYSQDPTCLIVMYKWNGKLIIDELIYRKGLINSELANIMRTLNLNMRVNIIADSAEPKSISDLKMFGFYNVIPTVKGADSVRNGINKLQEHDILITSRSTNAINEFQNYTWAKDRNGKETGEPIDAYNHCFVGSTLITTNKGLVELKNIVEGDYVLTSKGYKRVVKKFNNGKRLVNKYVMQSDNFFVSLCATQTHKVKTKKEWKQISLLKQKDTIYLHKPSMEKSIDYIQTKGILVEDVKDCILKFGNILKAIYQKVIMFITLTGIHIITKYQTLRSLMVSCIYDLKEKEGLKKIQNLQMSLTERGERHQKNGTVQKKELNGIKNKELKLGLIESIKQKLAKYVEKNTKQDTVENQNTVIKTARLKHFAKGESKYEFVYDIMVDECHEYFANGVLVHNCIDPARYIALTKLSYQGYTEVY